MVLLVLPVSATAENLVPANMPSLEKSSPAHISPNTSSPDKRTPNMLPPGRLSSSEVSQSYGGFISIAQSTAQAQTQAQLEVHTNLLRQLAHEPIIQYINTVTSTFSPPDVNGLIYYLYDFPFTHLVDPTTKTVAGTVEAIPRFTDLRQAVLASLQDRTLMERYGAIHSAQKASLYSLKSSPHSTPEELPRVKEDTSPVKSPSIAPHKNSGQSQSDAPLTTTSPSAGASTTADSSADSHLADDYLTANSSNAKPAGTVSSGPAPSPPPLSPPTTPTQHADILITLLKYQEMLRNYNGQWENPQDILAQLTELERLAPHNALVQGALAEVLLQLKRPQQAQQHSDTAVAIAKNHAYLYDTRGEIFLQLQLPSLATEAFTKAIELDNHNPIFFLHRATSYLPRNKTDSMCQDFNQACLLGDCSGYQWAFEQGLCQHDATAPFEKTSPSKAPSPSAEDFLLDKATP